MPDNEYADGMLEHDGDIGKILKTLDELGIANNTLSLIHISEPTRLELESRVRGCGF